MVPQIPLVFPPVTTTVTVGDVTQALAAQASATTVTATADVTFTDTQCPGVQYMCIHVTAGSELCILISTLVCPVTPYVLMSQPTFSVHQV